MSNHINLGEIKVRLKTVWAFLVVIGGIFFGAIWWATAGQIKLDNLEEATKPIPQMQQDIAVIKQAVEDRKTISIAH